MNDKEVTVFNREELMYRIMGSIHEDKVPIVFKGALITKLVLLENGYRDLTRETKDIDANWISSPPTMEVLVETVNQAIYKLNYGLKAMAYREYGNKQSAGIKVINSKTGEEVIKMDIDIKPVKESHIYWYGNMNFEGTTVNQIMCDKISSLSGDKIFRRIKDIIDVYALSMCTIIKSKDIFETARVNGREIKTFNIFLSQTEEIEYAYNKLRGINKKPLFNDVYSHVKEFIYPFLQKKENMIWNAGLWVEEEDNL